MLFRLIPRWETRQLIAASMLASRAVAPVGQLASMIIRWEQTHGEVEERQPGAVLRGGVASQRRQHTHERQGADESGDPRQQSRALL